MKRPLKILACMFQGGGNISLISPILAELIERRHTVRAIVGPGVRPSRLKVSPSLLRCIDEIGAELIPLREVDVHPFDDATSIDRGLIGSWTPRSFRHVQRAALTSVWAPTWARNVSSELRREPADIVVADFVLLGALLAAEAARIPHVALMHTVYPWPAAGVPPFGPGYLPKAGPLGFWRDVIGRAVVRRLWVRNGLPSLNEARSMVGLSALHSPIQQYEAATRVLVLASAAFDWVSPHLPANVRHVGTPEDNANPTQPGCGGLTDGGRPLVVVALSTLDQGQAATLKNILVALSDLPVRALVTLGPALELEQFKASANVRIERFVPHDMVLPHAAALVTQCGIGTLTKALRHGVPMVCLPLVGDQYDNAARVAARKAGVRLRADAGSDCIRTAIMRVIKDTHFKQGALMLRAAISLDSNPAQMAADEIEQAVRTVADDDKHASF